LMPLITVTGDVGIGTDEPSGNLHISSGTSEDCLLIIEADIDNNDENDTPQIWFKADGGINEGLIGLNNNTLDLINNVSARGGIRFLTGSTDNTDTTTPYTGATERMRITSDGIELGHASDTTITRVSAGRIAVEGVDVVTTSSEDTLQNKTFADYATFKGFTSGGTRLQATAVAGSTTLTLPAATDTLVGKDTIDILTNKTLTAPTITGAGAIAGVFTGNITGNVTGNADTVTTNADLTGPVTSSGNITAIADGAITTAMQKHLQTFEFNGYLLGTDTNYYFPSAISTNTGPFKHDKLGGANGTTAMTTQSLIRMGGKVMPYSGTVKLWKGWGTGNIAGSVTIGIFKYTPSATTPPATSSVALVPVESTTFTAIAGTAANNSVIGFSESIPAAGFSAGDILVTGIKGISGMDVYFTSTLEVEWD
jgi:hypothetical protein